jgi:DNA repair protein RadC
MRGLRIEELPNQQKPREKLLQRGFEALTDAEALAILLRTGIRGCNVIDLVVACKNKRYMLKFLDESSGGQD